MAVQFESAPAARPQPFAIYNNSKNTLLSDLGQALGALGGIPNQMQKMQLQDQVNKLLLQAITAPRTEQMQQQIDIPSQFTGTLTEWPEEEPLLTRPTNAGSLGSMLTQPTTETVSRTVPGKQYSEAVGRLKDVGYKEGGFDFSPRTTTRSLEDLITLETLKGDIRSNIEEGKQSSREKLVEMRGKQKADLQNSLYDRKEDLQNKLRQSVEKIASNKELGEDKRLQSILNERSGYHKESIRVQELNARARQKLADNADDIRQSRQELAITRQLAAQLTQLDKIKAKPNQFDPQVVGELHQATDQYNALVGQLKAVNPDSVVAEMTVEDTPAGWGNLFQQFRGMLPGGSKPRNVVPGQSTTPRQPATPNSPRPTYPTQNQAPTNETPEQRKQRLNRMFGGGK